MQILLISAGTAGNMLPFIGLGKALRARGHDVMLIGSGAGTDTASLEGLGFTDLDAPEASRNLPGSDTAAMRKPGFLRTLGPHAVRHMRRVYQLIADRYVPGETIVVAQSWLFGARIAQEKLGVPLATVYLQPLLFGSVHDTPGLPRWTPRWVPRLLNGFVNQLVDRGLAPAINTFRAELGLRQVPRPIMGWWRSPEMVIGFFAEWYSAPQPDWPAQTLLGGFPLYDGPGGRFPPELEEYLAEGEPPLVFSQAWLIEDAKDYFTASVAVARTLGRRAVLLTSHPEQLPRPLPPGIRHFGFVPLSSLLPRAAAIVHHGGMGTIGQSLAAGVPQLTVPMILDQFDNSRRLLRLGVSALVRSAAYQPATIARLLRDLLESPEVTERCRHYATRLRQDSPFEKVCLALEQLHRNHAERGQRLPSLARRAGSSFLPSPLGGEGSGVRGEGGSVAENPPLTPDPSPPRGEGRKKKNQTFRRSVMRVLLVSIGTAGDLLPFIALGKALRGRGHDVTVLGNGYFRAVAEKERLGFVEVCSAEEHVKRTRQRSNWDVRRSFREGGRNLLEDMPRVCEAVAAHYVPGETVVAASGMMFGARVAQEKLGLPLATIHLYPLCFRSVHDKCTWPWWLPVLLRRALFGMIERGIDRHFGVEINAFRARLGLSPVSQVLSRWWNSPQMVLGLFPEWLSSPQPDWPANTLLTGFPLYDTLRPFTAQRELDEFLSAGEPPLVFSHSSAVLDAHRFFAASVAVAHSLGRRAVLLTPHGEQIQQPLPPGVCHFPFVPHSHLLPRAAALVHHGGIGTAFQALAAGIPQLIVPVFLDQPDNGRRLTQLGVAETVRPGAYCPREVSRKLERLLQSEEVAASCREYAARCRQTNAAENACLALERLFAEVNFGDSDVRNAGAFAAAEKGVSESSLQASAENQSRGVS